MNWIAKWIFELMLNFNSPENSRAEQAILPAVGFEAKEFRPLNQLWKVSSITCYIDNLLTFEVCHDRRDYRFYVWLREIVGNQAQLF